jgi:HEPN domain-containing protein
MSPAERDALLNNIALRSFRDVADGDYILARLAYRADLISQALWSSQQAIEKYIKCILLLRRVEWNKPCHSLLKPLKKLEGQFQLQVSAETREFMEYIDKYGPDRYFMFPYYADGLEIAKLDRAVWEIRRYCIPYNGGRSPRGTPIEGLDIKHIEDAASRPPQAYRSLCPGPLDALVKGKRNTLARAALIKYNLYFGSSRRKSVRIMQRSQSANSLLALYPEIAVDLGKYVYLPKELRQAPASGSP